jgi:RNA polymerase sigma-70 factor (ECF subfamily)
VRDHRTARPDPPLEDEERLVRQARSGDSEAFAQLYNACIDRVYRYIHFKVSEDETAEDLTSQVFLKAWENLDRYKVGGSPFIAWLYTIARNLVIDHYRTQKEFVPLEDVALSAPGEQNPDQQVELRFELQALRDALQFLTHDQQEALILKFIAGLSNGDIARMMNKQEGAIRALQMRGLQTLAKYLQPEELA